MLSMGDTAAASTASFARDSEETKDDSLKYERKWLSG
jgi:hypothetical protein